MAKPKIVIVGGGLAGCAAAIAAVKVGAKAVLFEKTDMLAGAGLRAGRMDFNGKIMTSLEARALGAGEIFEALESIVIHRGALMEESHGYIYSVALVDKLLQQALESAGVEVHLKSRVLDVAHQNGAIKAVRVANGPSITGEAFIDCSGSAGGIGLCTRYGQGCMMCLHRCYIFGDRLSIAAKAGARELSWLRYDGTPGRLSPSITLYKESLKSDLSARLEREGFISIPLPQELIDHSKLNLFSMLRTHRQMEHINIYDIGLVAKTAGLGFFPVADFRRIPGFENAHIEHPVGAGKFNFINHLSVIPRDNSMRVENFKNLFVAGEKGAQGGINEVVATAIVAGNNAVRAASGSEPLILPPSTVIGDYIAYTGRLMATGDGLKEVCTMAHGAYFERMQQLGLYNPDQKAVYQRIRDLNLSGILAQPVA